MWPNGEWRLRAPMDTLHTGCIVQCSVCRVHCAVFSVQCSVCSLQWAVCIIQCTFAVWSAQDKMYNLQCAAFRVGTQAQTQGVGISSSRYRSLSLVLYLWRELDDIESVRRQEEGSTGKYQHEVEGIPEVAARGNSRDRVQESRFRHYTINKSDEVLAIAIALSREKAMSKPRAKRKQRGTLGMPL